MQSYEREIHVSGAFRNVEEINSALERMRFGSIPEISNHGSIQARIRRRRMGNFVFAEFESSPCEGIKSRGKFYGPQIDYICITAQLGGGARQFQQGQIIESQEQSVYVWAENLPFKANPNKGFFTKTIWIPRSIFDPSLSLSKYILFNEITNGPKRNLLFSQLCELHEFCGCIPLSNVESMIKCIVDTFNLCVSESFEYRRDRMLRGDIFDHCMNYINSNFSDDELSIDAMSEELGIGSRLVQKYLASQGLTFTTLVRDRRLQEAKTILSSNPQATFSLTELAHQLGFFDLPHFSRTFKNCFGCSPSVYQRKFQNVLSPPPTPISCHAGSG